MQEVRRARFDRSRRDTNSGDERGRSGVATRAGSDLAATVAFVMPLRLQLSRAKGFNLQRISNETNKLPAVNVSRPSKWGNPFRVDAAHSTATAVATYRSAILRSGLANELAELRGKNLACWCKRGELCHADVLLELANG
jgi:hypothetical protein